MADSNVGSEIGVDEPGEAVEGISERVEGVPTIVETELADKLSKEQSERRDEVVPQSVQEGTSTEQKDTEDNGVTDITIREYDYKTLVSKPLVASSNMADNTLELLQSFGYDCHKRSNLLLVDEDTLIYSAGNVLVLLKISTREHVYLRTLGGGGIGAITVHPSRDYFAVGEKGTEPVIAIYEYPSLVLHRILRGGTEQSYSHMDFNPDGTLLASIGGNPDYMLTVWNWNNESIVLRSKAFSQDIYRVSFSPELPGQLTTSGTGHIRFWKMALTFTGLKLQGYLGKFGRTELTDISAYVELPDGKVLSGTEAGNMLLWDGGFIKVELAKKGKKLCHNGNIECLFLDEGELISAGIDGYIKIWDFETIDNADISEDNSVYEMEPLTEIKVGSDVSVKCLTRSLNPDTPTLWYAQDAKGGIWKVDIVASHTRKAPERLVYYHSGKIKQIDCSPIAHLAASIAEDGSVRVYNLYTSSLLCHCKYSSGGNSLVWAPLTVDTNGLTLYTGFSDGVLRVLKINETSGSSTTNTRGWNPPGSFTLHAVCKPHTQCINSLTVDRNGSLLATGSDDCTVFFLNIKEGYTPIGYINVPAPVSLLKWSEQGPSRLLICCNEGTFLEVLAPNIEDFDTSKSYHLATLKIISRKFTSIKDRLRKEELEAKKLAEKEERKKKRIAEREAIKARRKEELGDDYESEEEEEEMEVEEEPEEQQEEEEEKEKPAGPSPILTALYDKFDHNEFWISMGGYDTGYIYNCTLDGATDNCQVLYESNKTVPVPPIDNNDIALHAIKFSNSGQYLLTGNENGSIRIHYLQSPYLLSSLDNYWSLNTHDNQYGCLSTLAISYDDQFIITGGDDGNVFVYKTNFSLQTDIPIPTLSKPVVSLEHVDDIDDPSYYSIEDAKLKAENEKKMKAAEAKKQKVRSDVKLLRRTYTELQQRSLHLPKHLRLSRDEFVMDPSISEQLHQQLIDKLELAKKEMAWESEKHNIALKKLQKKYTDCVECERIVVWTVHESDYWVSSFRSVSPSPQYLKMLEKVLSTEIVVTPTTAEGERGVLLRRKTKTIDTSEVEGFIVDTREDRETNKELSKNEQRRIRKEKRKKEWKELYQRKPGEQYEDPEEVNAIQKATQQLGDYKLKTSSDYVVSDQQRISTNIKRKELIICRNSIFEAKRKYNQKLIDLRDKKLEMVAKISELVKELKNIQQSLPTSLHKPIPLIPSIKPEEVPEKELEYTSETLLKFKKELKAREKAERQAAAGVGEGFGGFGGFGGGEEDIEQQQQQDSTSTDSTVSIDRDITTNTVAVDDSNLTDLEKLLQQEKEIILQYQQDNILTDIDQLINNFNALVMHLRHEKSLIDIVIKFAELKHLTQFEELELLKEFEKRETNFTSKYRTKKKERADLEEKIEEVEWECQEKDTLVSQLQEQEKNLESSFFDAVGENNKFKDFLIKVYRKKIKRTKQKQKEEKESNEDKEEEEEEEEETDSEDYSSSEEDSDEEGFDDTTCPPGCDQSLFNQTIQMREKRLDLEELLTEEKKQLEILKKDKESLLKKAKTMESHVKTALQDLQAFQIKKQQRLNELDATVVLKMHQILHYLTNGDPPTSVSQCLVFSDTARKNLSQRIGELVHEKQQEKKRYKELRQQHVRFVREKKTMEKKVSELNDRANEMMMLKFGRLVNLDALEGLTTNKLVGELEEALKKETEKYEKSKMQLQREIDNIKQELLSEIKKHTLKLDKLYEYTNMSRKLEEDLNQRQKNMGLDATDSLFDAEEKARLNEIVKIQSREINALQEEIKLLSHKGGHILPPSQPPHALTGPPPTVV